VLVLGLGLRKGNVKEGKLIRTTCKKSFLEFFKFPFGNFSGRLLFLLFFGELRMMFLMGVWVVIGD
jgi:hypothetical protein